MLSIFFSFGGVLLTPGRKPRRYCVGDYQSATRKCELENSYVGIEKTNACVDVHF
jgi:hypothetical protein